MVEKETKKENLNMKVYDLIKEVPNEAQKKITGGRLNGMTDIKPMWRIEKLTEIFGPVGLGWYTETTKKEIIDGANEEKIATVDILLYVNYKVPFGLEEELWSKPIEGSGGSSFIAKEKNGLYTSDECFKMAYTDALSVACKALGMGADIYWGDSKYTTTSNEPASEKQIEILKKIFNTDERMKKLLDKFKLDKIEDISKTTASELIKKNLAKKEEKTNE